MMNVTKMNRLLESVRAELTPRRMAEDVSGPDLQAADKLLGISHTAIQGMDAVAKAIKGSKDSAVVNMAHALTKAHDAMMALNKAADAVQKHGRDE